MKKINLVLTMTAIFSLLYIGIATSKEYDVRKTTWGMTQEQVKNSENAKLIKTSNDVLVYEDKFIDRTCYIYFNFENDKLNAVMYEFNANSEHDSEYIYRTLVSEIDKIQSSFIIEDFAHKSHINYIKEYITPETKICITNVFNNDNIVTLLYHEIDDNKLYDSIKNEDGYKIKYIQWNKTQEKTKQDEIHTLSYEDNDKLTYNIILTGRDDYELTYEFENKKLKFITYTFNTKSQREADTIYNTIIADMNKEYIYIQTNNTRQEHTTFYFSPDTVFSVANKHASQHCIVVQLSELKYYYEAYKQSKK